MSDLCEEVTLVFLEKVVCTLIESLECGNGITEEQLRKILYSFLVEKFIGVKYDILNADLDYLVSDERV